MKQSDLQRPLSRSERTELGAFLESAPSAMSLSRADGFLTGIASMPSTLMPSQWHSRLIGDHDFDSMEEADRVMGGLMRLFNDILSGLNKGRSFDWISSLDDEELSDWCKGYLEAARMDAVWKKDEYGKAALLPFGVLAGEFDLVGEEDSDGHIIEDASEHLRKYRNSLPTWVRRINEHWTAWRRDRMPAPAPAARPKVGRNEPCPCGSGRKYKKCCGVQPARPS